MAGRYASLQDGWEMARRVFEDDKIVEAPVAGFNKGGLLLTWQGLPGFVPASQLLGIRRLHVEEERMSHLRERQGQTMRLKIIEVDMASNRLIFSERATRVSVAEQERLLRELAPGERRQGGITNLADFGACVDLGGVDGLIHISELAEVTCDDPAEIVCKGDVVRAHVHSVNSEKRRLALSMLGLEESTPEGL